MLQRQGSRIIPQSLFGAGEIEPVMSEDPQREGAQVGLQLGLNDSVIDDVVRELLRAPYPNHINYDVRLPILIVLEMPDSQREVAIRSRGIYVCHIHVLERSA